MMSTPQERLQSAITARDNAINAGEYALANNLQIQINTLEASLTPAPAAPAGE